MFLDSHTGGLARAHAGYQRASKVCSAQLAARQTATRSSTCGAGRESCRTLWSVTPARHCGRLWWLGLYVDSFVIFIKPWGGDHSNKLLAFLLHTTIFRMFIILMVATLLLTRITLGYQTGVLYAHRETNSFRIFRSLLLLPGN